MNGAESSFVSKVKGKQDQDLILLELKANVHKNKVLDFEQGGDGVFIHQGRWCIPMVNGTQERFIEDIPFTQVPPRCTETSEKSIGGVV